MDLDFDMKLITYAIDKETEKALWDVWVALYPSFTDESFIPFPEFKAEQLKARPRQAQKSAEEITQEMTGVVESYRARERGE